MVACGLAVWVACCSPDKVPRGTSSGGGGTISTLPNGGGGIASGGGGATTGAGGGTTTGAGGSVGTGGATYVAPTSVASGGTTTVTWTVPSTGNKDAAVEQVCVPAAAPSSGTQSKIIMVVKSISSPGTTPGLLKTHLVARGFKVDYALINTSSTKTDAGSIPNLWFSDDNKTQQVDLTQYGLAVISKDGYKSGANLDSIPVLCGNNQTADSALAMATSDGTTSSTKSAFTLLDSTHPIAAGKTGDLVGTILLETGSSASLKVMLAVVPTTAHVVGVDWGVAAPGTSAAALFAYDVGDTLANGSVAKARRVGFFLDDSTSWTTVAGGSSTSETWQFFDASVDWLLGLVPCSGGTTTSTVVDAGSQG